MKARQIIIDIIEEGKKDRFILKNKYLSDDQKNELITLFEKKPHLEKQIKNWNAVEKWEWDDFEDIINYVSKSEEKRDIKIKGAEVLFENDDALVVLPYTKDASICYGSGTKWCTSAKNDNVFETYYNTHEITMIYVIDKNKDPRKDPTAKISIALNESNMAEYFDAVNGSGAEGFTERTFYKLTDALGIPKKIFKWYPIKHNVNESISFDSEMVEENKDRLIKKTNLSRSQQQELIDWFKKYPHLESGLKDDSIDWNRPERLVWSDFESVLNYTSKHGEAKEKKRKVKSQGINGLDIGADYIPISKAVYDSEISVVSLNNQCEHQASGSETLQGIYMPLNWNGSKLIASDKIGGVEGKWCTAYIGMDQYWIDYTKNKKCILIYVVYDETKYAILVHPDNSYGIFDQIDKPQPNGADNCNLPGLDVEEMIKRNQKQINEVRDHLQNGSFDEKGGFEGVDYKINSDGSVDVFGNVDLSRRKLTELPMVYNNVGGSFGCYDNELTSLEGAPNTVGDRFNCQNNELTSLEGAPKTVGGDFNCYDNELTSLEGSPKTVSGSFSCYYNNLTSLEGAPNTVGDIFNCTNNKLTSLEGAPKTVGGDFNCYDNELTSLEGSPKTVSGSFRCYNNNLTSLEGAPKTVGGGFNCTNNELTSLEGAPKTVGGGFYIDKFSVYGGAFSTAHLPIGYDYYGVNNLPDTVSYFKLGFDIEHKDITVNQNGSFDIDGDMEINESSKITETKELPKTIKLNKVNGSLTWWHNQLTSLDGFPREVTGDCMLLANVIRTLSNGPEIVGGDYDVSFNIIDDLSGFPKEVGGDFNLGGNPILGKLIGTNSAKDVKEVIEKVTRVGGDTIIVSDMEYDMVSDNNPEKNFSKIAIDELYFKYNFSNVIYSNNYEFNDWYELTGIEYQNKIEDMELTYDDEMIELSNGKFLVRK